MSTPATTHFREVHQKTWLLIGLTILCIGVWATMATARYTDERLRDSLASRAETIAGAINDDNLKKLSGTPADIGTDVYEDVKAGMIKIAKANPDSRFVYLMGFRDQKLFFYADSELPNSKDYSVPGDFYADASQIKIDKAFAGDVFTEGPYTDVWGSWVSGYAPVIDRDGTLLGTVGIDIYAKAWEEEIAYTAALPALVTFFVLTILALYVYYARRTAQYVDQIEQVDRMKSEFVSVASHQLRTPLTGIKWFAELLLKGKAGQMTDTQTDFVTQMYQSNDRMIKLVEDLLNVSRIDTGAKFVITKASVDIVPVLDSLATDLVGLCQKYKVKIIRTKDFPGSLILPIDLDKMRQVFGNLLSNAVKYSHEQTEVVLAVDLSKTNQVTFSLTDTGLGIPATQQSRVFEKFFRADNVQTKETDGTGLGLYIVKAIVEGHGGTIWFESKENVGTTFFVQVPRG